MSDFDPNAAAAEIDVIDAFRTVFDKANNSFASVAELRKVLTSSGEKLSNAEFDELISEAQVDSDGQINYEDFVRTLYKRTNSR